VASSERLLAVASGSLPAHGHDPFSAGGCISLRRELTRYTFFEAWPRSFVTAVEEDAVVPDLGVRGLHV
jgi:hypothetical protein